MVALRNQNDVLLCHDKNGTILLISVLNNRMCIAMPSMFGKPGFSKN